MQLGFEALARRKRKSSEKLGRCKSLSTGTLQLGDKEGAFSAGNEHAAWVYVQHFTRSPSPRGGSAPQSLCCATSLEMLPALHCARDTRG